jgi:hypothetical protein
MPILELRNYLIQPGRTREFIRFFEENFLFSQRDEGMHVLGQFEVVGEPDRFVWIRGFADMESRLRGLSGFYGGPFWQARRDRANEMILDSDHVHLLRSLGPVESLTGGLALEDRAAEPPGEAPPDGGLVAVDFYRTAPGGRERLIEAFAGREVLGRFVSETAANDFPRLPVIQEENLLVAISACREGEGPPGAPGAEVERMLLRPTARSLIRGGAYFATTPRNPRPMSAAMSASTSGKARPPGQAR